MVIVFRTDASKEIGSGHVMRCLTLANQLKSNGHHVVFIMRELDNHLIKYIEAVGYRVIRLPKSDMSSTFVKLNKHSDWLGVPLLQDASETKNSILGLKEHIDWLIVDHYAIQREWEWEISDCVGSIMVIDDLADRPHECDLLLDQNFYVDMQVRYAGLVPNNCNLLLGPRFALLREEFKLARANIARRSGIVKRVIIFFGGSDPDDETFKALKALLLLRKDDLLIDVIVGSLYSNMEGLCTYVQFHSNVKVHRQINNMAALMSEADLFIGAGGGVTWERCCLGLPGVALSIAFNQEKVMNDVHLSGAVHYLGRAVDYDRNSLAEELDKIIIDRERLQRMSVTGMEWVDGFGVEKVLSNLEPMD